MAELYLARFPQLASGSVSWSLPLFEPAAWSLVEALLSDDADFSYKRLLESVSRDASFALWAVCTAAVAEDRQLRTLADVARWLLATGIGEHLRWADQQLRSPPALQLSVWDRWGRLAGQSVRAVDPLRGRPGLAEDEAGLLALLQNARQWLDACMDGRPPETDEGGKIQATCLPRWLAEQPSQAEQESPSDEPHGQAISAPPEPAPERSETARSAWTLPMLIQRLLRLRELENNFASQLQREKLLAMKQLAYGAGHEINNPLANISSRAQTLLRAETDADKRRKLATINSQAFRAHEMIANMMLFANPPALQLARLDLDTLIDEVIDQLAPTAQNQDTLIQREEARLLLPKLEADAVQLKVALAAICTNSLEALGFGGQIRVGLDSDEVDGTVRGVTVRIHDTGPGIAPHARRHLFDPFYSGREAGRGLGFGLAKAWTIVTSHGGGISVDSDTGSGATFRIHLPMRVPPRKRSP